MRVAKEAIVEVFNGVLSEVLSGVFQHPLKVRKNSPIGELLLYSQNKKIKILYPKKIKIATQIFALEYFVRYFENNVRVFAS